MTTSSASPLRPDVAVLSSVFRGDDDAAWLEISRLAALVGVDVTRLPLHDKREGVLEFRCDAEAPGCVRAQFHPLFAPYFKHAGGSINYTTDSERLLELFAAVGTTIRGKVVGVVGAHGGAGATSLSAGIAWALMKHGYTVGLIDACPASPGIELAISLVGVPGKRWADLSGRGIVLPGKLNESLPKWNGIRVLSADERGAVPESGERGIATLAAVAQVNQWTIVDLPATAMIPTAAAAQYLDWCDHVFVVTQPDALHLAGSHTLLSFLSSTVRHSVVVMANSSSFKAAHLAQALGERAVHIVERDRDVRDAAVYTGDYLSRKRGKFQRGVDALRQYLEREIS